MQGASERIMYKERFDIDGKVIIITGGAGLLGYRHAQAILEGNGIPVILDVNPKSMDYAEGQLHEDYGEDKKVEKYVADITDRQSLEKICGELIDRYGHIDGLINNAANNPKVEGGSKNLGATRFTDFPVDIWNQDIAVGLTGALLCSQVFGKQMELQGSGVIINISSVV